MNIFISYSFRPENAWIESHVEPLIECFGHKPVTGRILEGQPLPEEVKRRIAACRRVLCFATRANPRRDAAGAITDYEPPDWVRDELILARAQSREAIEFRETGVRYGGASAFHAWHDFDRDRLPDLMLRLSQLLADWPVGPLQLRLLVPEAFQNEMQRAANAHNLRARCVALDESGTQVSDEELQVRLMDGRLTVPFWIKADPDLAVDIEISLGARRLACRGISPTVREAPLQEV